MEFKKAVKRRQRLRLAIDGVSGSGKMYGITREACLFCRVILPVW
jgi:hypothetical protein